MKDEQKTKLQLVAELQELRQQIDTLECAEKLAKNLLETANTLVITLDNEANITSFNSYAEKLTGYTKTEVLGRNWVDIFIPQEAKETIPEVLQKAFQNRPEVSQFENGIILKNGEERLISWCNNVVRDNDGQTNGVLSVGIDITEQKQALEKIKKISSNLESRVQERTLELEQKNEQLQQNKLEIEKKNITLRVLLDQQLATREELEGHMASRLQKLVYPYLDLLGGEVASLQAKEYIEIIAAHLDTMTSSFVKKLSNPLWHLTHREMLVADLVYQGKSTREIGRLLNISPRTAERYRNTIRKKMGLTKKKTSLYNYLNSVLSDS